ncbi:hypothetical protein FACS189487_05550 [Campylobacterota bacterium]|nr:hypothetical protein FACS189487_05550 [Campylobacterota bacterium]
MLLLATLFSLTACGNDFHNYGKDKGKTPPPPPSAVVVTDLDLSLLVTAPVTGQSPDTVITTATQYDGIVAWKVTGGAALSGNFAAATSYTATVTLTAKAGFTFTGVVANSFSHSDAIVGGVANPADSNIVTIAFPATDPIPVTGVSLNKSATSIAAGLTETLIATVLPTNATVQTVSWSSDTPSVATVDASGTVTAVAAGSAIITVTTTEGGFSYTCTVTVTAAVPKEISVETPPTKIAYATVESDFNPAGLVITVTYSDDTTQSVIYNGSTMGNFNFDGYDTTAGTYNITGKYGGKDITGLNHQIVVYALSGITIKTQPSKTAYATPETSFDPTGLVISTSYSPATHTDDVTYSSGGGFGFSGYNTIAGTKTISVTYGGAIAEFDVVVYDIDRISVKTQPTRTAYGLGSSDTFEPAGLVINQHYGLATYTDDVNYDAGTFGIDTSLFNTLSLGDKNVSVTYNGLDTNASVTVYKFIAKRGTSDPFTYYGYDTLQAAFATSTGEAGQTATITLYADEQLSGQITIGSGTNITLIGNGSQTIKGFTAAVAAFRINSGGALTLSNDVNITGQKNTTNLITSSGGAVLVIGGTFTMNGGIIEGNQARMGGGVLVYSGSFVMSGGKIRNNTATESGWGGGVHVYTAGGGSTFTIQNPITDSNRDLYIYGNNPSQVGWGG